MLLIVVVAVALVIAGSVFIPRLGWKQSDYGYDIVEEKTVSAEGSWSFPLPFLTVPTGVTEGTSWPGTLDIYVDPELTYPYMAVTGSQKLGFTGVTATLSPSLAYAPTSDNLPVRDLDATIGTLDLWPVGTYYIVQRKSFFNNEFDRPRVHVYTVEPGQSMSPVQFTMDVADGVPRFQWTAVDNAASYYILAEVPTPTSIFTSGTIGPPSTFEVIGVAGETQTTWLASGQDKDYQDTRQNGEDIESANSAFWAYSSDTDLCTAQDVTYQGTDPPQWEDSDLYYPSYAVVAVDSDGGTSRIEPQDGSDVIRATPVATARQTWRAMADDNESRVFIPDSFPVTMGDCRTAFYPVSPQSLVSSADEDLAILTYGVTGTLLTNSIEGDRGAYDEVVSLGEGLGLRTIVQAGTMEDLSSMTVDQASDYAVGQTVSTTAPDSPYTWNGTSEMVTYIAANFYAGQTAIDMSRFVEDPASPLIYDAANEALLQNPLITDTMPIIGIVDNVLYVSYEMTPEDRSAAAGRVKAKVDEVVSSIITPGMSDRDKALAINNYLAKNAVYDTAAADFSMRASRTREDYMEHYPNAWDAEGVLIDGTGVCSSYAAAFKALADASGLVSVTVTGLSDTQEALGHEWVKAQIEGQWLIIDPTWNSNIWEQMRGNVQTYFGLKDSQTDRIQFDGFVVDSFIPTYDTP